MKNAEARSGFREAPPVRCECGLQAHRFQGRRVAKVAARLAG